MYHDFAGREIEDLEMDNMRQDARDEQARAKVTAQMLHEAFASIEQTALPWTRISHEAMRNYTRMAEHINAALALQAVCDAPESQDYVWSSSESGEAPRLDPGDLVFLSRDEAEKITRAFLQEINGSVDEDEVQRIMAQAGQSEAQS